MRPDQPDVSLHMPYFEELAAKSATILELGVGLGNGSTRAFVRGMERSTAPHKRYVSVDMDTNNPEEIPTVPYWVIVYGRTEDPSTVEAAKGFLNGKIPDVLYIDTHHVKEQLAAELALWSPLAGPQTVWIFHDTFMFGFPNDMVEAIEEFCIANPQWKYTELTKECHGLGRMEWAGS